MHCRSSSFRVTHLGDVRLATKQMLHQGCSGPFASATPAVPLHRLWTAPYHLTPSLLLLAAFSCISLLVDCALTFGCLSEVKQKNNYR
jgi:hypothetical protein